MTVTLRLPELPGGTDEPLDPAFLAAWSDGSACWPASWPIVLAMAVRDGATEVHYHPWRTDAGGDALSYLTGGIRYGLVTPDAESKQQLIATARRLAAPGLFARIWSYVASSAVGRVKLVAASGSSDWCVVCWGRSGMAGVEFLRLSPVTATASLGSRNT